MFDGLKIRNKLVLLVAGPMVIIVLLAALGAKARQDAADESADVAMLVSSAEKNATLIDALQDEALYSTGFVASGREQWKTELAEARKRTDAAGEAALGPMQGPVPGVSANLSTASALAVKGYSKLDAIRHTVDQGYQWTQVVETYQATESGFLLANETIAASVAEPSVSSKLRTSSAIASYKSALARQGTLLLGARTAGTFGEEGIELYDQATEEVQSKEAILNSIADTTDKGAIRDAVTTPGRLALNGVEAAVADATATTPITASTPEQIAADTTEVLGSLHEVEVGLDRDLVAAAESRKSNSERAATLFIASALLGVLLAAAAAVLLGRRITRPLQNLTEAADKLSKEQMPKLVESLRNPAEDDLAYQLRGLKPIEVSSQDEIGQLASAFNDVQKVAGEVAAEQAALLRKGIGEMFVNLARRNQALLDRQIDFIDELERAEEDPDQLENLYRLDHLATRMRRNAESLLVLAGAEPPRRRGRPAPLANVVRAALAEVEDFARIELLSLDEVLVASNASADIAHLLSELMENATNFSPPETRVEVVGHRTKADGYIISVTDQGIGMSAEQMAEANELLSKPPVVGLALSRSLGFIVVGRLARRHGISVKTMASASGGVTAIVTLPPSIVTDGLAGAPAAAPSAPPAAAPNDAAPLALADPPTSAEAPSGPPLASVGPVDDSGLPPLAFDREPPAGPSPSEAPAAPAAPAAERSAPAPLAFSPSGGATGPVRRAAPSSPNGAGAANGNGNGSANGLPTRRLSAAPAPSRTNGSSPTTGSPTDVPERTKKPLPPPSVFDAPPRPEPTPEPVAEPTPAPAPEPTPEPVAEPTPAEPAAKAEPPEVHSDGPPPVAPLAARSDAPARPTPITADRSNGNGSNGNGSNGNGNGGFLGEAGPPRLRPGADDATPADDAPPAEPAAAESGTRLFGGESPTPLATRGARANGEGDGPVKTSSGLAKRTPRSAGGSRAIPGADVERNVGATRRSPDEVRNLLSRYRDGQQRAKIEPANQPVVEEIET